MLKYELLCIQSKVKIYKHFGGIFVISNDSMLFS